MNKKFNEKPDWKEIEKIWLTNYERQGNKKSLSSWVLSSTHKIIEQDSRLAPHYDRVLEVGVGTMEHFKSVTHSYNEYLASDHDKNVVDRLSKMDWDEKVSIMHLQGNKLPFDDNSVDRLIASHVLEHINNPEEALKEWVRVIRPGGVLSILLPCDPGFLWRVGRFLGPRKMGTEAGLPYNYYMAIEHRNSIHNLFEIIKFHFDDRKESFWPLKVKYPSLNLIYGVNCYI